MPKINTPEILNKSITKDKLSDEVQNKLNDIGTLSALRTNSKDNLVKAINEVFQSGTNKLSNIISAL